MKKVRRLLKRYWKRALFAVFAIGVTFAALLTKLSSLAPSLSPTEKSTLAASTNFHAIIANPLHLPLKVLEWPTAFAPASHQVLFSRLPSVLLAMGSLLIFIYILRRWYGPRTMVFGFVIFASSAWFLHVGRFASTDIEYLTGMLALLAVHVGLYDHDDNPFIAYIWVITNLALLFIPGFIWLVLLSLIWQRPEIIASFRKQKLLVNKILPAAIAILGVGSLAATLVMKPDLLRTWLGVPEHFASWQAMLRTAANTVEAIVYAAPHSPELWLGRLPILDAFLSIMLIAGLFFYARHWRAIRTRLLLSYFLLCTILISLGGAVRLSVLVPLLYLVAIGGIAYVLHFWLGTFPRNPLARAVGFSFVAIVIGLSCFYNLAQYFIAWPHNTETAAIYRHKS